MELVDILTPPTFAKSGTVKPREQAIQDGDWLGTFNLWIIQTTPVPSLLYQQRSMHSTWEPGKLDTTAGGHFQAGETLYDGLREVKEELGKTYAPKDLYSLGRKLNVSPNIKGFMQHTVVELFFVVDNSPLETYTLEKSEVSGIFSCPIEKLLQIHTSNTSFLAPGMSNEKETTNLEVSKTSFPYNWDNYHYKIALLADKFTHGEKNLVY